MTEPNGKPIDPESTGPLLAAEMLKNLVILNDQLKDGHALHVELKDSVDQLIGHFEVFGRAMEIICEQKEEGKSKFNLSDFAEAYLEAADEIMPAEDEPGDEDPLVESRR
jgi:hypothetical protein